MKIRKGLLIVVKDARGGQVVGLDSNYAQTLIDNHGKGNSYSCELGHGLTITFTTYTDHRSLFAIWKHKILERIYQRQLQKALKRTQRMQSSIPTATTDSDSKSSISSSPPNQEKTPSLITSNDVAGLPDGSTERAESYEHRNDIR